MRDNGAWILVALLALGGQAEAASLGIPADAFLATFTLWIVALGFLIGIVGLAGWAASHMSNAFGGFLSGSPNLFATAGLLGGGTVIMGLLGLAQGALVP